MSGPRKLFVSFLIFSISAIGLYCLYNEVEIWPFSSYSMYSYPQKLQPRFTIFFVDKDGRETLADNHLLSPLDPIAVHSIFSSLNLDEEKMTSQLKQMLQNHQRLNLPVQFNHIRLYQKFADGNLRLMYEQ